MTVRIHDDAHAIFGMRRFHLSNGKGLVPENPSYDGIGGYVGVVFTLE